MLVYTVIARGNTVLAEWSDASGNFATITRVLLGRLKQANGNNPVSMVSYMYDGKYVFHTFEQAQLPTVRFIVLSDKDDGVKIPYKYLRELYEEFVASYGTIQPMREIALAYSDSFAPLIRALQVKYNGMLESGVTDSYGELAKIKEQVDAIHNVMVENIDALLMRGERLDLLVEKAETIESHAIQFQRQTVQYRQRVWWRQRKLALGIVTAVVAAVTTLTSIEFGIPFRWFL